MLTTIQKYQPYLLRTLLCIYISGTFHVSAYEVLHLCMHIGDIVDLNYTPHSHQSDQTLAVAQHSHSDVLNQLDIGKSDGTKSGHVASGDEIQNHEIAQDGYLNFIEINNREAFHYCYFHPIHYLKSQLPPPKFMIAS